MYIAKMCLNSVRGGPINFILGADIRTTPQQVGHKTVAMATLAAEQRGHESAFYNRIYQKRKGLSTSK